LGGCDEVRTRSVGTLLLVQATLLSSLGNGGLAEGHLLNEGSGCEGHRDTLLHIFSDRHLDILPVYLKERRLVPPIDAFILDSSLTELAFFIGGLMRSRNPEVLDGDLRRIHGLGASL